MTDRTLEQMEADAREVDSVPPFTLTEQALAGDVVALVQRVRELEAAEQMRTNNTLNAAIRRAERERIRVALEKRARELEGWTEQEAAFWEAAKLVRELPELP